MKELKNCKKCGKLFSTNYANDYCAGCEAEDEVVFRLLKDYLYDNPGINVNRLSEILKVDQYKIYKFIKDGRLKVTCTSCKNFGSLS